jgi:hypothetical protein
VPAALDRLREAGIPAALIGEMTGEDCVFDNGEPLPRFPRDELARYLEERRQ